MLQSPIVSISLQECIHFMQRKLHTYLFAVLKPSLPLLNSILLICNFASLVFPFPESCQIFSVHLQRARLTLNSPNFDRTSNLKPVVQNFASSEQERCSTITGFLSVAISKACHSKTLRHSCIWQPQSLR